MKTSILRIAGTLACIFLASGWITSGSLGVSVLAETTRPIEGIRSADPSPVALVDAQVVTHPAAPPRPLTILIEGRQIRALGESVELPSGAETISLAGKTIYAGFIDSYREIDTPEEHDSNNGYWNANIAPRRSTESVLPTIEGMKAARGQGITAVLAAPSHRIVQGQSRVVLALDPGDGDRLLADPMWQHLQLTAPRRSTPGESYPRSPMGATALLRQAFYDATWYRDAWDAHRAKPRLQRPETDLDLAALADDLRQRTFVIDAPNERMAIRAGEFADEFAIRALLKGSGREYRAIDEIARQKRPLLLPLDFPEPPNVDTQAASDEVELRTLQHWHFAPRNAAMLDKAGVEFAFTSDGLDKPEHLLKQVRRTVEVGLPADVALAALTTTPAELIGVSDQIGTIEPGKLANLVIFDREWLAADAKVVETWVAGKRFSISATPDHPKDALVGEWNGKAKIENIALELSLKINESAGKWSAEIGKTKLRDALRQRHSFSALIDLPALSETEELSLGTGVASLTVKTPNVSDNSLTRLTSELTMPDGRSYPISWSRVKKDQEADEKEGDEKTDKEKEADEQEENEQEEEKAQPSIAVTYPLGAHGRTSLPAQPDTVVFRGATVWSCDGEPHRVADVLVTRGRITEIGPDLKAPRGCQIVDARGKHLTPGLIDCHSHIATDGGINESGQAVTAEVRIGDFIDPSDVTIYRHLAGGVTAANIMHGSANPIGGQNQVIKMRWGGSMSDLRFAGAPLGIKFALGENVKRNSSRYPNTRMGVEQLIRDRFLAARQYAAEHRVYGAGDRNRLPPRRDLELEAIAEIQAGKRWIHCHSYRQDEIVATLDVLEEFGVRIGTLQHILEGYKVADRIAAHGAMASSFADWWAYKFEVFDAIPYNGVLMHDAGVVVSYNSDDPELGRHLNTEAAKAVKYGGVDPEEALKFVTLNPARQLRIDDRVGSIEVGKDADLVLWSGPPLSTLSRCEQTWIDGRCYFALADDQKLRERDQETRAQLVQMIRKLDAPKPKSKSKTDSDTQTADGDTPDAQTVPDDKPEEDRWIRYDQYCTMKGGAS